MEQGVEGGGGSEETERGEEAGRRGEEGVRGWSERGVRGME
jgi:hypothetical protein